MEKILITGSAGFIGYHLVNQLALSKYDITGLDVINDYYDVELKYDRLENAGIKRDKIAYNVEVQSNLYKNYKFIKLDLGDKENIAKLFETEKFDYVINLAAQAGVRYSIINPYAYIESNVSGFLNILEGCRNHPVKHLIYASSSSVYGANKKIPFSEDDGVDNPVSLYAATKKSNELFAHTYSHLYGIPTSGLRFFTVYGPWGRPDMAYFMFTKAVLNGEAIKVFNNGNMQRDFTYIDDITAAIKDLIHIAPKTHEEHEENSSFPLPAAQVYNIGNNSPVELTDFISEIEKATGKAAKKQFLPMQQGDVPVTYANVDKLSGLIGHFNRTSLAQGIEKFTKWYLAYYS